MEQYPQENRLRYPKGIRANRTTENSDPVGAVLQRFPGPVTLKASRKKWAFMLAGALVIIAFCIYALAFDPGPLPASYRVVFWVGLAGFAFVIPMAIAILVSPRASRLVLDRNGFQFVYLFGSSRYLWKHVTDFAVFNISAGQGEIGVVEFDDITRLNSNISLLNKSLAGRNYAFADTYGLTAEDLARLMNQWRERALK